MNEVILKTAKLFRISYSPWIFFIPKIKH